MNVFPRHLQVMLVLDKIELEAVGHTSSCNGITVDHAGRAFEGERLCLAVQHESCLEHAWTAAAR